MESGADRSRPDRSQPFSALSCMLTPKSRRRVSGEEGESDRGTWKQDNKDPDMLEIREEMRHLREKQDRDNARKTPGLGQGGIQ